MSEHPLERSEPSTLTVEQQLSIRQRPSDVKAMAYLTVGSLVLFVVLSATNVAIWRTFGILSLVGACIFGVLLGVALLTRAGQPERGTDFDLARIRLERRNRYQVELTLWMLGVPLTALAIHFFRLGNTALVLLPFVSFGMGIVRSVQLYYNAPKRRFSAATVEDEMRWIFGEDWSITTGPSEFLFAQDRLRRRRLERWLFVIHIAILIPIFVVGIAIAVADTQFPDASQMMSILVFGLLGVWIFCVTLPHAWRVFPTRKRLERRERRLGEALRLEQQRMYPEAAMEKAKRKRYAIGDDGELVEVSEVEG